MSKSILSVLLVAIWLPSPAQYTRHMLDSSDVVVVGTISSVSDSGTSQAVRVDTGDIVDKFPVVIAEVETVAVVKGLPSARFRIAFPKTLTYDSERPTAKNHVFCIRQNQPFLFFLQANSDTGFYRTSRDRTTEYSTKWKASSADYAPIWLSGTSTQYWMSVRAAEGGSPIIKLANLLIASAIADETSRRASLMQAAQDISPLCFSMFGINKDVEGDELRECIAWRDSVLPVILGRSSHGVLNSLAIQITWGRRDLSSQFATNFLNSKPTDLDAEFPQFLEAQDRIRLLRHPDPHVAAQQFGNVISYVSLKQEIFAIGGPRFGESRDLDIAILYCLSQLYERPDISPYVENRKAKENLEREIALARRLGN